MRLMPHVEPRSLLVRLARRLSRGRASAIVFASMALVFATDACGVLSASDATSGLTCSDDPTHGPNRWIDQTEGKSAKEVFSDPKASELADAARKSDTARMRTLLRGGANPNSQGARGITQLDWAIRRQSRAAFDFLLGAGANPALMDSYGDNVVRWASRADDTTYLAILLAHHVDPNIATDSSGSPPITQALMANCDRQMRMLMRAKGIDLNRADVVGDNVLITAAMTNDFKNVLVLLKAGADPLARNKRGDSFQLYLGMTPVKVMSQEGKNRLAEIRAWLTAHGVAIEKGSS
jgi:ankyrin repeat protein